MWLSLVERCLREADVAGSNPVTPMKNQKFLLFPLSISSLVCIKTIGNVFYSGAIIATPPTWSAALEELHKAITKTPKSQKIVLFIDELHWMVTKRSRTLCEIKFTDQSFEIDKKYYASILNKKTTYEKITKTSKQIFIAFISVTGLKKNTYTNDITSTITLDNML